MKVRKISAEYNLLFSCIKHYINQTHLVEKPHLLDESQFLKIVDRHRLAPLIHTVAERFGFFSEQTKSKLRKSFEQNVFKSMSAKMEMLSLLKMQQGASAKMLYLKGLTLAEKYYGDTSHRHTMDLDVWVEAEGIHKVINHLSQRGYESSPDWSLISHKQRSFFQRAYHDLLFTVKQEAHHVPIELHWRLREGNGQFKYEPMNEWHTMTEMPFGNALIPVMNDIDQFIYLCVHGTEHAWFRLKWLVDLPMIMSQVDLDWDLLYKRAVSLSAEKHVLVSMLFLHQVLEIQIPEVIRQHLKPSLHNSIVNYFWKQMLSDAYFNANDSKRLEALLFYIRMSNLRKHEFGFLLKYCTNPNDWKLVRLPDHLFFLYFILRPFLFIYRRLKKLVGMQH